MLPAALLAVTPGPLAASVFHLDSGRVGGRIEQVESIVLHALLDGGILPHDPVLSRDRIARSFADLPVVGRFQKDPKREIENGE